MAAYRPKVCMLKLTNNNYWHEVKLKKHRKRCPSTVVYRYTTTKRNFETLELLLLKLLMAKLLDQYTVDQFSLNYLFLINFLMWSVSHYFFQHFASRGCSAVVARSLCMWKAPGSIPGISNDFIFYFDKGIFSGSVEHIWLCNRYWLLFRHCNGKSEWRWGWS